MPPAVRMSCSPEIASVAGPTSRPGVTPSIVPELPALPTPTIRPSLIADVGLDHPEHRIHDGHVRDHQVERAALAGELVVHAHAVAQRLAAAVDRLIAQHPQVPLDLDVQVGVAEPDLVADGRAEEPGVFLPRDLGHRAALLLAWRPVLNPYSAARRTARAALGAVAAVDGGPAVDEVVEAVHPPLSAERDQGDFFFVAGFEPHRGAGRDVEPVPERLLPVELQGPVDLEEVEVGRRPGPAGHRYCAPSASPAGALR